MRTPRRSHPALALLVGLLLTSSCDDPVRPRLGLSPIPPIIDPDDLIADLSTAYRTRDIDTFNSLFPATTDSAPYLFVLNEPVNGVPNWDYTEEYRIQRRMFKPEDPVPGEIPVPAELWLNSITITLARTSAEWAERTDLYRSDTNSEGLDPQRWRATEAEYHADILFDTAGDTDYRVDGRANFVVIEDLAKQVSEAHKFLIYRWEDLGNSLDLRIAASAHTWSQVKAIYR